MGAGVGVGGVGGGGGLYGFEVVRDSFIPTSFPLKILITNGIRPNFTFALTFTRSSLYE